MRQRRLKFRKNQIFSQFSIDNKNYFSALLSMNAVSLQIGIYAKKGDL
jgi:hypothetical protein